MARPDWATKVFSLLPSAPYPKILPFSPVPATMSAVDSPQGLVVWEPKGRHTVLDKAMDRDLKVFKGSSRAVHHSGMASLGTVGPEPLGQGRVGS